MCTALLDNEVVSVEDESSPPTLPLSFTNICCLVFVLDDKVLTEDCRANVCSVADPDPGSGIGALLTPGSGIRNRFIPDPGSRIPNSYF